MTEYFNIIILDIDKLSKEDLTKASYFANQSEFTYANFISPLGNDLKILENSHPKTIRNDTYWIAKN